MKKYKVTITKTYKTEVYVEANSLAEAEDKVSERWLDGEYANCETFEDVSFEVKDTTPIVEMNYQELTTLFRSVNDKGLPPIVGYVVFTENSFDKAYDEEARTYKVSSDNKAFQSGMGGYSIFASCVDGTDPCARIDLLMRDEYGWKVEKSYMLKDDYDKLIEELAPYVNAPQERESR